MIITIIIIVIAMFIILSIHTSTQVVEHDEVWIVSRGDRLRGTRVGSRNTVLEIRFSNPPLLYKCTLSYLLRCKNYWLVIILSQVIAIGTDALSSIRSQSTANVYNNSVASSRLSPLRNKGKHSSSCVRRTPTACNISCHVTSRVNDRHHLLVIRVQNFARTR